MFAIVFNKTQNSVNKQSLYNNEVINTNINLFYSNGINYTNNGSFFIISKSVNINENIQELLLDNYISNEYDFLNIVNHDFTGVIINKTKGEIFIIRDRFGIYPIYYYNSESVFIVSDKLKFIKEYINTQELENEWLNSLLTGGVFNKHLTAINGIKRLSPSNYIKVNKNNINIKKYWSLTFAGFNNLSLNENIEELQYLIKKSVEKNINKTSGAELSGGLDSSAIVGFASKIDHNLLTYSHSLPNDLLNKFPPFYDESKFFNKVLEYNTIEANHKMITCENNSLFEIMNNEMIIHGAPINKVFPYLSNELLFAAKQDGVNNILSGFGGDEGISNMGVIEYYNWARGFNVCKLLKYKRNPVKAIYSAYFKKLIDLEYQKDILLISDSFFNEIKTDIVLKAHFEKFKFKSLTDFVLYKLNEEYIPNRIENMAQSSMEREIHYSYPLLDYKLLEFYISVPDKYKFYKARKRYIFKEAVKGFVPNEVYLRNDKTGAAIPNALHRFMLDYDTIYDFLQSSKNGKAKEYIDFNKMFARMELIKRVYNGEKNRANQHLFFNALMLVMYIENNK